MDSVGMLRLLQLFDSQFPVGAFAHSGGLETYGQAGARLPELRELIAAQIALGWGRSELAAAQLAWTATSRPGAATDLARLGAFMTACKVVPSIRETSLRLGRRTLALVGRLHPDLLAEVIIDPPHHAVVIGGTAYLLGLPLREMLLAYANSLLAGSLAAATRCMPVSPAQAQAVIVEHQPALARAADRAVHATEDMLFTCTPALDIRCQQQAALHTRLFQS